jgi:hypothetical protein
MRQHPRRLLILATPALGLVAVVALISSTAREARSNGCKPDGKQCTTNVSCCGGKCVKPVTPPGRAKPLFGTCCTPTTCTSAGATCGVIDNCGGTLNCGTCDASTCLTCGAGHTCVSACTGGQVCFQSACCTPTTCGAQDCGMLSDDCGGTLDCGPCPTTTTTSSTTTTTSCTPTTCSATDCGPKADGCGGTLLCTDGCCQSIPCNGNSSPCVYQCSDGTAPDPFCVPAFDTFICPTDCNTVCERVGSTCPTVAVGERCPSCGDGNCDGTLGENPCTCPNDCFNDPNSCEACECTNRGGTGSSGGTCSCDPFTCLANQNCCTNTCTTCEACE